MAHGGRIEGVFFLRQPLDIKKHAVEQMLSRQSLYGKNK